MEEQQTDSSDPLFEQTNTFTGWQKKNVPTFWIESARRSCFPSIMRVKDSGNNWKETLPFNSAADVGQPSQEPSQCDLLGVTSGSHPGRKETDGCLRSGGLLPTTNRLHFCADGGAESADVPQERAKSSEQGGKIKVSLGRRWLPYVNGTIRRYDVPARVGDMAKREGGARERFYCSIEELEQRHKEELREKRLPRVLFAPQIVPPRQFVVRTAEVDPRVVADEANTGQQVQKSSGISAELLERKVCFDTTLGAVRPYALGEGWRQRGRCRAKPGVAPTAMPLSYVLRDPMEVFVEAMRYQRPTIGVYAYDVH